MNNREQGIALIMVLVMLLIMTLTSVTAIQQNKLQFAMVGNTQEQSQTMSRAENILKAVENNIEQLRWSNARTGNCSVAGNPDFLGCMGSNVINNDVWRCKGGGGNHNLLDPGTNVGVGVAGSTATIVSWWCQNNPATGTPASCTVPPCPVIANTGMGPPPDNFVFDGSTPQLETGCGTELYTIRVQYAQQNQSGALRTVESKFSVKCNALE